ncbi:MAG TPA: hypothetical protein P5315_00880 [Clostridia bacterium]|nr:hypothetical protein [Clostridia bacterium]
MINKEQQKKNILFGYLYMAGGVLFMGIMTAIFATDNIKTDTREIVVMALIG